MAVRKKEDAARILCDIEGERRFYCNDGCIICNIEQLAECLTHMSDQCFEYHVASERDDFSNWIRDVLGDDKLARDVSHAPNCIEAANIVKARVNWLQKKLKK